MANVKNRRIVVDGVAYRWSSIGQDDGVGVTIGLEGERMRPTGRRILTRIPYGVLVLPSLVRRILQQARLEGWDPNVPTLRTFLLQFRGPFRDEADPLRRSAARLDDEVLLEVIRAAPDEDGPRLVYADWRLERNDPRGEFIVLSCQAATRTLSTPERTRMESLLAEHEAAWLGPVYDVTRGRIWQRGFLVSAMLMRTKRGVVEPALGHVNWWSVRSVDTRGGFLDTEDVVALLAAARFDALEELTLQGVELEQLEALGGRTWVPRVLHVINPTRPTRLRELAARLGLRELRVNGQPWET